jgi:plasmid stabilization system protein ParE
MEYRVDISIPALQDAESAFLWIRGFNIETAKAWYEGLLKEIFTLEQFPYRCPVAPESRLIGREIRHLIYGKRTQQYRIFFEINEAEKVVRIYRIWHSAKQWITKEEFEEGKPPRE